MPQLDFDVAGPAKEIPDHAQVERESLAWMRGHGLLRTEDDARWYLGWNMARNAACSYPDATREGLRIATDFLGVFSVWDEIFEGPLGRRPERARDLIGQMTRVLMDREVPARRACSLVSAWMDLWPRIRAGRSEAWLARARPLWKSFFDAYGVEAVARQEHAFPDLQTYLHGRRSTTGIAIMTQLAEVVYGFELPAEAAGSALFQNCVDTALDAATLCNDVQSLEKEEARGDLFNGVLVVQNERSCSREDAIEVVSRMARQSAERFMASRQRQVDDIADALGLDDRQRADVDRYLCCLGDLVGALHAWGSESGRYTAGADRLISQDRIQYAEAITTGRVAG